MDIEAKFRSAARKRLYCTLTDKAGHERIVQPYGIFLNSHGVRCFCVFQTAGHSESGGLPEWRNPAVSMFIKIEVSKESFQIRSDYQPENRTVYPHWLFRL
jgi:hypothetical protein